MKLAPKDVARFWSKVEKGPGCWEWQAKRHNTRGYGCFAVRGAWRLAHRVSWTIAHGAIPDGKLICHRCDNRTCVRPDHLFLGTAKDNTHDMIGKGRHSHGDAHWARSRRKEFETKVVPHLRKAAKLALRGSAAPNATLTEDQVLQIRRRHAHGETQRSIAADMNLNYRRVNSIVLRRSWKHVGGAA